MCSWQYFEPDPYAEKVLVRGGFDTAHVADLRMLQALRRMPGIKDVHLDYFVADGMDLSALDDVGVSAIEIRSDNIRSLSGVLREWLSVRVLSIAFCGHLKDISALPIIQNMEGLTTGYCDSIMD